MGIDPRDVRDNSVPPPVAIEQVLADGELVFADGAVVGSDRLPSGTASRDEPQPTDYRETCRRLNTTSQTLPPTLRLPPGHGRFLAFRFTANSFVQPGQVRFKHRLVGHDSDWIDDGTQRAASYPNLRPGRYRLQVIAANADGVWNHAGASLSFVLAPFFYQALWFRLALAAGLLLAVFLLCW